METNEITITAEPQARPDQCLFRFDRKLYSGVFYTSDPVWSEEWAPFAAAVFSVGGIRGVSLKDDQLLITLVEKPDDWRETARGVGQASRDFLQNSQDLVKEGATEAQKGDDLLRQRAQTVIDERLNPGLASHGGFIDIVDSEGRSLFLNMGGGCQGCSSAAATMVQGVETALRDAVPELDQIVDATNHAMGANPYM